MKTMMFAFAALASSVTLAQTQSVPPGSPPLDEPIFEPTPAVDAAPDEAEPSEGLFAFGRRADFGGALAEVKVGAGGGDFTQDRAREATNAAASWDVRAVLGAHTPLGVEAAYTGSTRSFEEGIAGVVSGTSPFDDTYLVSNGLEGDVRLALPVRLGPIVDFRPFAFGGVGWQYMSLWGDGPVEGDRDRGDHIMTVPAGVGLELGVGTLNVEARGTYRHAVGSDLFGDAEADFDDPNALHSYNVGGSVGVEF